MDYIADKTTNCLIFDNVDGKFNATLKAIFNVKGKPADIYFIDEFKCTFETENKLIEDYQYVYDNKLNVTDIVDNGYKEVAAKYKVRFESNNELERCVAELESLLVYDKLKKEDEQTIRLTGYLGDSLARGITHIRRR